MSLSMKTTHLLKTCLQNMPYFDKKLNQNLINYIKNNSKLKLTFFDKQVFPSC